MQKLVLKLDIHDEVYCKQKAIKLVSSIPGIDSISMDVKEKKLTVLGDMDSVAVVKKLRRNFSAKIVSVGPAEEPQKPIEAPIKAEETPKKAEEAKDAAQVSDYIHAMQAYNSYRNSYYSNPCYSRYNGYARSMEENPNGCITS